MKVNLNFRILVKELDVSDLKELIKILEREVERKKRSSPFSSITKQEKQE